MNFRWPIALVPLHVAVAASGGCLPDGPVPSDDSAQGLRAAALGPEGRVTLESFLAPVYCSSTAQCGTALRSDPSGGERQPALVTGLACATADPDGQPVVADALLAFHANARCYDGGDTRAPATWTPAGGVVPQAGVLSNRAFALRSNAYGDGFFNATHLLTGVEAHAFCVVDALGVMVASDDAAHDRHVVHTEGAPWLSWRVVVTASPSGDPYDCHLDEPDVSVVTHRYAAFVAHDVATPVTTGTLPAQHSFVMAEEAAVETGSGVVDGLVLRYALDSVFPPAAGAPVHGFELRADLWVADAVNAPVDSYVVASCAERDGTTDTLDRVAVALVDGGGAQLGAIAIHREWSGTPFECERTVSGSCALTPPASMNAVHPCLAGGS